MKILATNKCNSRHHTDLRWRAAADALARPSCPLARQSADVHTPSGLVHATLLTRHVKALARLSRVS